jgi:cytolethal distending toxin subunit B
VILTTWNLQGSNHTTEQKWQTGIANLFSGAVVPPDAICLQEAGGVPRSARLRVTVPFAGPPGGPPTSVTVYEWGGTSAYAMRNPAKTIVYHHWDVAGNRVNTAIVTRTTLPHPPNVTLVWGAAGPVWRPAVGVFFRGEWIFSFHAISPGGADATPVLNQVAAFAGLTQWRVGGDFNRDPLTLMAPPAPGAPGLIPAGSIVCPPNSPTHPATRPWRYYDYFVCQGNVVRRGRVDESLIMSDHRAVDFQF